MTLAEHNNIQGDEYYIIVNEYVDNSVSFSLLSSLSLSLSLSIYVARSRTKRSRRRDQNVQTIQLPTYLPTYFFLCLQSIYIYIYMLTCGEPPSEGFV